MNIRNNKRVLHCGKFSHLQINKVLIPGLLCPFHSLYSICPQLNPVYFLNVFYTNIRNVFSIPCPVEFNNEWFQKLRYSVVDN